MEDTRTTPEHLLSQTALLQSVVDQRERFTIAIGPSENVGQGENHVWLTIESLEHDPDISIGLRVSLGDARWLLDRLERSITQLERYEKLDSPA